MEYTRWKYIRSCCRKPSFTWANKETEHGITDQEMIDFRTYRAEYERKESFRFFWKIVFMVFSFFALLFSVPIGISLLTNYWETKALENLTGKKLNYWDVYWAGSKVRANGILQDAPNK